MKRKKNNEAINDFVTGFMFFAIPSTLMCLAFATLMYHNIYAAVTLVILLSYLMGRALNEK